MRKREDEAQSKSTIVKFIVVQEEIYNSIEELMNWMGNYGPDYLGFSLLLWWTMYAEDYDGNSACR